MFQTLLDGLGEVLAFLYRAIPNYGVAIILLTLGIRVLLLPLAIKQIRSMHAMQALQPKLKALQQKYKGRENRQRLSEEQMKLYKDHGVNPLGGCLPLVAQFPVLIALFAVLQFPKGLTHIPHSDPNAAVGMPQDSQLYVDIVNQRTHFLGMNLLCNAQQAGNAVDIDPEGMGVPDAPAELDCGSGGALPRIPYYVLALAMVGTTYYQQRQMQRASPPGASKQQQTLTRVMPLLFGFWGFIFPAGLVLYWTTTNLVQIGQQHFMLPKREPALAESDGAKAKPESGIRKATGTTTTKPAPKSKSDQTSKPPRPGPAGGTGKKPATPGPGGQQRPTGGTRQRDGRSRKKRRKR